MKIYGNHFRYPKLWIKRGNEDEIEIESITPNLKYLGDDEDPIVTNTYLTNLGGDGRVKSIILCKILYNVLPVSH
ncbi:hypothetical protein [Ligilactobacillus murinus]|uniref:hypothetical protein n=1 Tax=Ligilactobacillus murinus TaxID=1622 RepID=UPI0013BC419D|nr:hypothetical protein [Ligilactobacillus murinus]NEF85739.1 hypothetical protein [Ligilactobacillus murinus]NEF94833.1 hypothetical protein [Ligilactobacillus murinus]NEF97036.1 hypothetical protein [Ligilactobacillus murinus]NEG03861.1 hypothetical protein [Ligilactobacillus murinus]NEG06083.1 hypothetical protein [Ligilactobacillus murinus]